MHKKPLDENSSENHWQSGCQSGNATATDNELLTILRLTDNYKLNTKLHTPSSEQKTTKGGNFNEGECQEYSL